jgi:predicted amidohydrolase
MAAARVNRMVIACSDRTHLDGGRLYTEGSAVIDAQGWVVTPPLKGTGSVSASVDLDLARSKQISTRNHLFDDRRPAIYS